MASLQIQDEHGADIIFESPSRVSRKSFVGSGIRGMSAPLALYSTVGDGFIKLRSEAYLAMSRSSVHTYELKTGST